MKLKSKMMMLGVLAAFAASVHAELLDLAGANRTVKNVSELAAYDGVTLELLGGILSIPAGQTALVGEVFYLDGNGNLKPLKRGTYGPGDGTIGAFFAPGSGSIRVRKGVPRGFMANCY